MTTNNPVRAAYLAGLRMLTRRELSEAQVRERLARRGYDQAAIDAAVDQLVQERAIDDRRTAEALARSEASLKGRGRRRVLQRLQAAGIASGLAREAVDAVFRTVDADALLHKAIERRLRGRPSPLDIRDRQRLYRALVGQGFDPDAVLRALESLRRQ